jgi:hypothetical protein
MIDLNSILVSSPGWVLNSANAINNSGLRIEAVVLLPKFSSGPFPIDACQTQPNP